MRFVVDIIGVMQITRSRGCITGSIVVPSSKSYLQRAIAAGAMAEGVTRLHYKTLCEDAQAAIRVARALDAEVWVGPSLLEIRGSRQLAGHWTNGRESAPGGDGAHDDSRRVEQNAEQSAELLLPCGESGLCMRMFAPIAALLGRTAILEAQGSLCKRPMGMLQTVLPEFGVKVDTEEGHAPVRLSGKLHGGNLCLDASESSQVLTGLLLALPLTAEQSILSVVNPTSRGYLDLTISVCARFGVRIRRDRDYSKFIIPGNQRYQATDLAVEGDWSAGAFLVVMGAIAAKEEGLLIQGLDLGSTQPDKAILAAARSAGAKIAAKEEGFIVRKGRLKAFRFDATDCPDLFPPLVVLAAAAPGRSVIKGVHRLRGKESDRAQSLVAMLDSLGGSAHVEDDCFVVDGKALHGGMIDPNNDHRIAMAAEAASLITYGEITICDSDCVDKSWPGFFEDINSIKVNPT